VPLPALVARVVETLARILPENIRVKHVFEQDIPPVLVDPGQMDQVLVNLCLNARDAMPDGGDLTIEIARKTIQDGGEPPRGDWVCLTVRDTGVGMTEETLRKAFEPFFTTKGELGSGLGLASVYGIVQQTGGHVSAQSEPGRGTTFQVLLPLAPEPPRASVPPASASAQPASATILVAEDEPPVRRLIVESLKKSGYTVLDVENGDQALEVARRHRGAIDLLCTDGVMPGMASRELITGFRRLFPEAAIIVCSGHIEEQALRDVVEKRALRFLPKPFTSRELMDSVALALAKRN